MTRQELKDKCLKEIEKAQNDLESENEELNFYNMKYDYIKDSEINNYIRMGSGNLLLALYNVIQENDDFFDIQVDLFVLIDALNKDEFSKAKLMHEQLYKISQNPYIVDLLNNPSFNFSNASFSQKRNIKKIFKAEELKDYDWRDIYNIIKHYHAHYDELNECFEFISMLYDYLDKKSYIEGDFGNYEDILGGTGLGITVKKDFKKQLKQQEKDIIKYISMIRGYRNSLNTKQQKKEKKLKKDIMSYQNFIDFLEPEFQKDEIITYEHLIKKLPSEEIRKDFLKMVYNHNLAEYQKTKEEYDGLSKNSYIRYLALLKDSDIGKEEINLAQVMKKSYEDTETILHVLERMGLSKSMIITGLEKSGTDHIFYIKDLVDKGIISNNTIEQYPNILKQDSEEVISLNKNLEIFKTLNLNPANLISNPEVLIGNKYLEQNIKVLNDYSLLHLIKSKSNYGYLSDPYLASKIDMFLELGLEGYLTEDITLLNENNIERLYVLKSIGMPIFDKDDLLELLRSNKFFISQSELKKYIPDFSGYYFEDETEIDDFSIYDYSSSVRTFNINGTILSKKRYERNLKSGLSPFKALIKDAVLDMDEIENIKETFKVKTK